MPLQTFRFNFAAGINEGTRSELVEPPALLLAQNVQHDHSGSLSKRVGFNYLTKAFTSASQSVGSGTVSKGKRLALARNEILQVDGTNLYSYAPQAGNTASQQLVGYVPEALPSRRPLLPVQSSAQRWDVVAVNGYIVTLHSDSQTYLSVFDAASMACVYGPMTVAALPAGVVSARLMAIGNRVIIFYADAIAGKIFGCHFLAQSSTFAGGGPIASPVALVTDFMIGANVTHWDVNTGNANELLLAYVASAANVKVARVGIVSSAPAVLASQTYADLSGDVAIGIGMHDGTHAALYYQKVLKLRFSTIDSTTLAVTAGPGDMFTMQAGANVTAISAQTWSVSSRSTVAALDGANACTYVCDTDTSSGFAHTNLRTFFGIGLLSRLFSPAAGSVYGLFFVARSNTVQPSAWLVDVLSGDPGSDKYVRAVCRIAPSLGAPGSGVFSVPASVVNVGGKWRALVPVKRTAVSASMDLLSLDFAPTAAWQSLEHGDATIFSGGIPTSYDGTRLAELGFETFPEGLTNVVTGGGGTYNGTVSIVALYRDVNGRGDVAFSAPSPAMQVTGLVNASIAVKIPTLLLSSRRLGRKHADQDRVSDPITIEVYSTTNGGSVLYLVGTATNDPTVATVTVNLTSIPDGSSRPCYAQPLIPGTALARMPPPAALAIAQHQERVFILAEDGKSVFFSGVRIQGEEPWFSPLQQFQIERGAPVVTMASYMGRLFFFSRRTIQSIDGDGPPDNGIGGEYPLPTAIPAVLGCVDGRSIVEGPEGLWFMSEAGLAVLNRGLQVELMLEQLVTLAAYPVVTGAANLAGPNGRHELVWSLQSAEGAGAPSDGRVLVWDYDDKTFMTRIPSGNGMNNDSFQSILFGPIPSASSPDAPVHGLYGLTPGGQVQQENPSGTVFLDAVSFFVEQRIGTAWIKLTGLSGYQRVDTVQILISPNAGSASDVSVDVYYDFAATSSETHLFTAAQIAALDRPLLEFSPTRQECSSIRFVIYDAFPTGGPAVGAGQGPSFLGVDILYQAEPGLARRPAGARS